MRFLIIPLLAAGVVLALLFAPSIQTRLDDSNAYKRQVEQLDLSARLSAQLDAQRQQEATAASRAAASNLGYLGAGAGVVIVLMFAVDFYRQRRAPLVRFDANRPLVSRAQIEQADPALLAAFYRRLELGGQAEIARAVHQPGQLPHSVNMRTNENYVDTSSAPAQITTAPELPSVPSVTSFSDVLHDFTPTKDAILLALGDGGEKLTAPIGQLCHVALCGATGQGKSNLLRLLLPQLQYIGAKVVLADPHYADLDPENGDDWRAICGRLYMPPAVKPRDIDQLLSWMLEELDRRLVLRNKGQRVGAPLFLAYDELPVIVDSVKDAPERLGKILREGRKVNMLTVGASQDFLVKTIGSSTGVRDCYRTAFYVGGDRTSAAALLDMPARTIDDGPLGHGVAMLRSKATPAARLVRVPLANNASIYQLLNPGSLPGYDAGYAENTNNHPDNQIDNHPGYVQQDAVNPRVLRVREMLQKKASFNEIVRDVWHVDTSSKGKPYQAAMDELRDVIAAIAGGAA